MTPSALTIVSCAMLAALGGWRQGAHVDALVAPAAQFRSGSVRALAAGKLLVAARGLPDPNFSETVILLAEHSDESSMGLVINNRTEVPLSRLFPRIRQAQGRASAVFAGGPVSPDGALALLRSNEAPPDSRLVLDDVYLIASAEGFEKPIAAGLDQARFRVYVGYAGWGPGQLARETTLGAWHVFSGEAAVVFDPDPETLWHRQVRRTEDRMAAGLNQTQPDQTRPNPAEPALSLP